MINKKIQIIPAILAKSFEDLEVKLNLLKEAYQILGMEEKLMVQIDICDDELFENINFSIIQRYLDIFDFELDLMNINIDLNLIDGQSKITERFSELGNSGFERIVFHYEDWGEKLSNFEFENFSPDIGLALIPNTSTKTIYPYLNKINFVQFMGIDRVGVQGSSFNPAVIEKIREFRKENPEMIISVDGGVNLENSRDLVDAGAERLAIGSAIFGENNSSQQIAENIEKLNNLS
ncbi:MAG: hypothetical protein KAS02_01110 [Candidatus Pacebacteria bacterium]|nr:hypothetical protein [Candidatus Paceibacterota bacterium]